MKLYEFRDCELVVYFDCHRISEERLMCLWCVYVKADPTDNVRSERGGHKSCRKGFLPLRGVLGETKGSNSPAGS